LTVTDVSGPDMATVVSRAGAPPVQTQCNAEPMLFGRRDRPNLVADFDGAISSDASALLLGAADRAIG
jgi:hypothetical protein